MEGIINGFRITDKGSTVRKAWVKNHKSAVSPNNKNLADKEIKAQIEQGNYILASRQPAIISPLGAIPKSDGSVRLIHDGSLPEGLAMNDYTDHHSVRYQTIQDACRLAKPGYFCAKLDLKSAYRSVPIHPDDYKATGLAWQFEGDNSETILFDARLPFGSACGPSHFSRLSDAIKRMMQRKGHRGVINYIDDFLLVSATYAECDKALQTLISLVRKLGLHVSWTKVVCPTQHVTFLGVDIDTTECTLSLGQDKLNKLHDKLRAFAGRRRATKVQLQSLAGSLNWACQVVRGGRFFLRRILDTIKVLRQAKHKAVLGEQFQKDLNWWLTYLDICNGTRYYNEHADEHVLTDACRVASGCFYNGDWQYSVFHTDWPRAASMHINYKEVCAVASAVSRWAPMWAGRTVVVHTDSAVTKAILNKGRSKNAYINDVLRLICWKAISYDFEIRAIHVPGSLNCIPDAISRLHESGQKQRLAALLANWHHGGLPQSHIAAHMSFPSFRFLSSQGRQQTWPRN